MDRPLSRMTVGICETEPILALGVRAVVDFCQDIRVVWAVPTLEEAVRMALEHLPQVLLIDKAVGMYNLLSWIRQVKRAGQSTGVTVWGSCMTEAEALRLVRAGVEGVIQKTARPEMLLACLRAVGRGAAWIMEDVIERVAPGTQRNADGGFTPRESQVLRLVRDGLTNREIAGSLGIRTGTVKVHVQHLYDKASVRGRNQLILSGLSVPCPDPW